MSQRDTAKTGDKFTIIHKMDGSKNMLTISPITECGYESVTIELTKDQWGALKYGFATMVNDKEKLTKIAYVY